MTALHSVDELWYKSRVSWRLKRCFFVGREVHTALSSIEASCRSKAQYQALTSQVTCLARRVMAGAAALRGEQGQIRTMTNNEVLRFWRLALCDVESRVQRLSGRRRWCRTQSTTQELEPYDERGVVRRMECDVRALFLDRELAADFRATDVTVLRFQSLTVPIPFRRGASKRRRATPRSFLRKGCRFDAECEACFGSIKALATHVLRHHRQMETVSRLLVTNQCPACRAVYGSSLAVINSSWVLS